MYTMILADGARITNLELNGNNYISNEIIDQSVFDGNLSTLTITDGETEKTYSDMKLVSLRVVDNQTWIIVAEKTEEDKRQERLEAMGVSEELLLELAADHEYRLCLMELGLTESEVI